MPKVIHNIDGTSKPSFSIGPSGPVLRQGATDPIVTNAPGNDGDLYIQTGVADGVFQRRGGSWKSIGGERFKRTAVTSASYTVDANDVYIGVNHNGAVSVYLPAGITDKQFIIKDESGTLDGSRPINIIAHGADTIDGSVTLQITEPYTSFTLVYGAEWHII